MGCHERRQRCVFIVLWQSFALASMLKYCTEFSGTLLGFDDYVSKYSILSFLFKNFTALAKIIDMVLEDVTELYAVRPSPLLFQ